MARGGRRAVRRHRVGTAARVRKPRRWPDLRDHPALPGDSTRSRISCSTPSSSWPSGGCSARSSARCGAHGRAVPIAFLLGVVDELFQRSAVGRSFEIADLAANAFGIVLGIGLGPLRPSRRMARGLVAVAAIGASVLAVHSYRRLRHFNRGLLHTRQGDLPKALVEYRLALRDGLDSPSFYNELAWIEVESGMATRGPRSTTPPARGPRRRGTPTSSIPTPGPCTTPAVPRGAAAPRAGVRGQAAHVLHPLPSRRGLRRARGWRTRRVAPSRTDAPLPPRQRGPPGRSSRCGAGAWP